VFGLPKVVIHSALALVLLLGGFWALSRYGKGKYDDGRREAEIARTDSVRVAMTRAIDSVHATMVPVLEGLVRENDSLRLEARRTRIDAVAAVGRARRAEARLRELPDSILAVTPPEVRALIDSLVASSDSLAGLVQTMTGQSLALQAASDSALAEAGKWKSLQEATRTALDTAALEIEQLKRKKDPPRCGWKCGFTAGVLTVGGIVATIIAVAR
jgi:hypothetical protein